ncbi:MAG TPA: hypothetical protein VFK30_06280, partial [Anaerolineae bacterium]|nr:hypothetical protein [Anaerolineae bacterium]
MKSYDASSDADDTPIRIPRLSMSAEWRLAGAAIDLDFAGNRIYPSGAFTDYLSCSRASIGYAKNASGTLTQFSNNTLRITSLGLLVESARTNDVLHSQDFSSDWLLVQAARSSGFTAPDDTTTAEKIIANTENGNHDFQQSVSIAAVNYTVSVFAKAAEYNFANLELAINGGDGGRYSINVNLTTGAIADTDTTGSPVIVAQNTEM